MEKRKRNRTKGSDVLSFITIFTLIISFLPLMIFSSPAQAQSSGWTKADGLTPGYDNISNNIGESRSPQILLDSYCKPNVVWVDYTTGNYDIFFSKWNGYQWTKADGQTPGYDNISNNSGWSDYPQIILDSSGNPNIVWLDNIVVPERLPIGGDIFFSKWNGSSWTKADGQTPGCDNISNSGNSALNQQFILDSSQRPNIVWENYTTENTDIYFSKWNGTTWTKADGLTPGYDNVSNNSGDSELPQMALDANQRPNIVWYDYTPGSREIFFSKWNESTWTKADGSTPGYDIVSGYRGNSDLAQIVLDSQDRPNIAWDFMNSVFYILFSKWNGSQWTKADGQTPGCDYLTSCGWSSVRKIILDSAQRPNILWENGQDVFFSKWNGSQWTKADGVTSGYDDLGPGSNPQILLDSSQRPNIGWGQGFSKWNGSQWTKADGVTPGYDNVCASVFALDASGRPNIVWDDSTTGNNDIFFSEWSSCISPISRLEGDSRYETAVEVSKQGWSKAEKVIIARGDDFPDALSGASLAGKYNCPILLTNKEVLTGVTRDEIKRLGTKEIFLLGSEDAIYPQVVEDLKNQCGISEDKIKRIGGEDRYDTSGLISQQLSPPTEKSALVATGENYPDALSAAALSYSLGLPIFLVGGDKISPEIQKAFSQLKIEKIIALGGEDVLPQGYINWFTNNGANLEKRISGDDRYGTARAVAQYSLGEGFSANNVYIATGENFPDALALGPLAGKNKSAILLTSGSFLRNDTKQWITDNKSSINKIYIAGGSDVVSGNVEDEIASGLRPSQ